MIPTTDMHYLDAISDYFGQDWLDGQWDSFRQTRLQSNPDKIIAKEIKAELCLHPLIYEIANYQDINSPKVDLGKIPQDSTFRVLSHFGRDLLLLKDELALRGNNIKKPLKSWKEFNNYRFMILVAAGYKLLGYSVEFLPTIKIKGKKTADLKVTKNSKQYLVECKMKNQSEEDDIRYIITAEFAEELQSFYLKNKIEGLTIAIDTDEDINKLRANLVRYIECHLLVNLFNKEPVNFDIEGLKVTVSFFYTSSKKDLLNMLEEERNIKKIAHLSRTLDAFVAVDAKKQNLLILNKRSKESYIPLDPLDNANQKEKGNNKLLVYYDMGRNYESWTDSVAEKILADLNAGNYAFENIDCLFTCQTLPKYRNKQVLYQPNIRCVGRISKIGGNPQDLELLGFQGQTGMEHYFINFN